MLHSRGHGGHDDVRFLMLGFLLLGMLAALEKQPLWLDKALSSLQVDTTWRCPHGENLRMPVFRRNQSPDMKAKNSSNDSTLDFEFSSDHLVPSPLCSV